VGTGGTTPADGGGADNLATGSTPDAQPAFCGSVLSDPLNCGMCGRDCNHLPNVQAGTLAQCHFGRCVVPLSACVHGFGNCNGNGNGNGNGNDGCEADLSRPEHCSSCGRACPEPMPTCVPQGQSFSCLISCVPATPDLCFDTCVDLSSDRANCGACGNDCNQIQGVLTPVPCRAGICAPSCASGWADCTTEAGCETPLDFEDSCGACGGSTGCHLANVSSVCNPGQPGCADPVCKPGYANCDVVSPDCEAAWGSTPAAACAPRYLGTFAIMNENVSNLATAMAADGSLFIGGSFSGTVDLDPTGGVDHRTATDDGTGTTAATDAFVTKLNADGSYAWTQTFGGIREDQVAALSVAPDGGSVVATGSYRGEVDFDPGAGVDLHTADLDADAPFVLELKADGTFVWAGTFDDTSGAATGSGRRLAVDAAGGIYVGGTFGPRSNLSNQLVSLDFDPSPGVSERTAQGYASTFVVKLSTAGALVWADTFDGSDCSLDLAGITVSAASSVWATGTFSGTCDFDPGTVVAARAAPDGQDSFIVKLLPDGSLASAWSFGVRDSIQTSAIVGGTDGAIYLAGDFQGTIDFDLGPAAVTRSASYSSGFVLKLTEAGALGWVQKLTALDAVGLGATSGGGVLVHGGARQPNGEFHSVYVSRLGADQSSRWTLEAGNVSTGVSGLAVSPVGFAFVGFQPDPADLAPGPEIDTVLGPAAITSRYAF